MLNAKPISIYTVLPIRLLCVGILLAAMVAPAQAKWLKHKKDPSQEAVEKVQTFQPPPPEALTQACEPIRAEAVALSQKPWIVRPFYGPRRFFLEHKHQQCRDELMSQEYIYLKHADIEQAPSLPKMNTEAPPSGGPNGNLP